MLWILTEIPAKLTSKYAKDPTELIHHVNNVGDTHDIDLIWISSYIKKKKISTTGSKIVNIYKKYGWYKPKIP